MSTTEALFADLQLQFGEKNGGSESFTLIDNDTISCRYADLCIRRNEVGWRYGSRSETHATPAECYASRGEQKN